MVFNGNYLFDGTGTRGPRLVRHTVKQIAENLIETKKRIAPSMKNRRTLLQ